MCVNHTAHPLHASLNSGGHFFVGSIRAHVIALLCRACHFPESGKRMYFRRHYGHLLPQEMGFLRRGHLVVARKSDLLGRYSNRVALTTSSVIRSALGGVLFVDEAYSLVQGEADLGRECLNVRS